MFLVMAFKPAHSVGAEGSVRAHGRGSGLCAECQSIVETAAGKNIVPSISMNAISAEISHRSRSSLASLGDVRKSAVILTERRVSRPSGRAPFGSRTGATVGATAKLWSPASSVRRPLPPESR